MRHQTRRKNQWHLPFKIPGHNFKVHVLISSILTLILVSEASFLQKKHHGTIEKAVKTFGCEIPTNIHHSVLSIVSQHTLKVRCQKGYKFDNSNVPRNLLNRKIRYLKCRNSKIVNKYTPKCVSFENNIHQTSTMHHHQTKDVKERRFKKRGNSKTQKRKTKIGTSSKSRNASYRIGQSLRNPNIQSDEANAANQDGNNLTEDTNDNWIPYDDHRNAVEHESGDIILLLEDTDQNADAFEAYNEENEDYDDIDDYSTGAENAIADYDDYPQYDYNGEYEEGITGSGGPDYGQYYDYDYDSRNPGPTGREIDTRNEDYEEEEEIELEYDENTNAENNEDDHVDEIHGKDKSNDEKMIQESEEISEKEILLPASSTTSTSTTAPTMTTTTTQSTTTSSIPTTTEETIIENEEVEDNLIHDNSVEKQANINAENDNDEETDTNLDSDEDEEYNEEYDDDEDYDEEEYEEEEEEEEENASNADEEAELLYRSYEILSGFYKTHFVDLRVLDSTCEPSEVPPPAIMHGHVKEYRTTENILVPGQHYHEVIYECDPGYKLTDQGLGHMFCQQKGWMGIEPYCEEDPDDKRPNKSQDYPENDNISEEERCTDDQGCEHMCRMVDDVPTCSCREGYQLQNVTLCVDIDECLVNNGDCEHECINKPGTYTCSCPTGYMVDGIRCIDTNECTSNNGHGPCQDTCVNTEGSFQCSCENIPGTKLDTDDRNCVEIDLCEENNGGCSHECLTSYGQSFCMCPDGYKLDVDYKTCVDTDECESMETILETCGPNAGCINTEGSFQCIDLEEEEQERDEEDEEGDEYSEESEDILEDENMELRVVLMNLLYLK